MVEEGPSLVTCFVGHPYGMEAQLVPQEGLAFRGMATASLRGAPPWAVPLRLLQIGRGVVEGLNIVGDFQPQAILATGGYVCAPLVIAGWLRRIPILLYLPDIDPGLAIRALVPLATKIALSFPISPAHFPPQKTVVTGYPVREEIYTTDKETARKELGLPLGEKVVLVLGGSRGAHSINLAVSRMLPRLLPLCYLIHLGGYQDEEWLTQIKEGLPEELRGRYRLYPYLHREMAWALVAADLAVARAGASTLGEFPAAGLASVLVPYPYAAEHQERNAEYLVERGAAAKIKDEELEETLWPTVERLLSDEGALGEMSQAARRLAQPGAAQNLARELRAMIREG